MLEEFVHLVKIGRVGVAGAGQEITPEKREPIAEVHQSPTGNEVVASVPEVVVGVVADPNSDNSGTDATTMIQAKRDLVPWFRNNRASKK